MAKKGQKAWNKGIPRTEEVKSKISRINKGMVAWNKGLKGVQQHSEETKKKMAGRWTGERNPRWKGGISIREIVRPRPEQCETCGTFAKDLRKGLFFDHDHKTGKFRGWICTRCNVALGMVNDSVDILISLTNYIKNSK